MDCRYCGRIETSTGECDTCVKRDTTLIVNVEYTDTFCGEANYGWVHRDRIELPIDATDRQCVMAAKEAMGLRGVRCTRDDWGDETIALIPDGMNTILFLTFENE